MFNEEDKKSITVAKGTLIALFNKKMSDLKDDQLKSMFFDKCIISGGAIASILLGTKVNDIDVYSKKTSDISLIAKYLIDRPDLVKSLDDEKYADAMPYMTSPGKLVTHNAITLTNDVQFITLGSEENGVRKNFDFIHCMPYYDIQSNKLFISEAQMNSIKEVKLVLNPSKKVASAPRIQKYVSRGWKKTWDDVQVI